MGLELTRPLKVANFIEEGKLGGPQIRIVAAAAAMKGRVDTTVIMPEENSEYFRKRCESEGIEYVLLPISRITKEWRVALRYIFFSFFEIVHIVRHLKRNSYDLIAAEMARVLKSEGYLFLTFPAMTKIREWKAKDETYLPWQAGDQEPEGFYQFALSPIQTASKFSNLGFELVYEGYMGSFKGIKDEVQLLNYVLSSFQESSSLLAKVLKRSINEILPARWFGHMAILIFKKK